VPLSDRIAALGVTLDTFRHHVSNVGRSSYFHLLALHYIRWTEGWLLTEDIAKTLAVSLIRHLLALRYIRWTEEWLFTEDMAKTVAVSLIRHLLALRYIRWTEGWLLTEDMAKDTGRFTHPSPASTALHQMNRGMIAYWRHG